MPCGCSCLLRASLLPCVSLCRFLDPTQSCGKDGKGGLVEEAQPGTVGPWGGWWSKVRMGSHVQGSVSS